MVIEFAPKPKPPAAADKAAVPKKPVDTNIHAEPAPAAKSVRPKAGETSKETTDKNGELF
jgi:hypothetical protein